MAAYSAYRHVELDKIGFGKRRVLKPPGGGTSDLFASPPDQADSPRKARAPAMSLPLGDTSPIAEADVPVYKPGNDSHSRLFGPPDPPKVRRQVQTSNIFGLSDPVAPVVAQAQDNAPVNETDAAEVTDKPESNAQVLEKENASGGNPVTGEGYESPKSNGTSPQINAAPAVTTLRNRVPPGGFSSGLW